MLFEFGIGGGMMKRAGEFKLPCGTPLLSSNGFPTVFPIFNLACLSLGKLLHSLLSGSGRLVSSKGHRDILCQML